MYDISQAGYADAVLQKAAGPITMNLNSDFRDLWNAFMVQDAEFSINDIPLCPTTADSVPTGLVSYKEANTIHRREMRKGHKDYHINAFVHFYIHDRYFDGKRTSIWLYPMRAIHIIRHFDGVISPDFSTYADFPKPIKMWNFYRMCAFGYWAGTLGIPVISNCRWGTEETWDYCFDGNPCHSMLAIGTVASNIRLLENRPLFEDGLLYGTEILQPHTLIVYGSVNNPCFDILRSRGVDIVHFPSQACRRVRQEGIDE